MKPPDLPQIEIEEVKFYPGGTLRSSTTYLDGKPHGSRKLWRPNGTLLKEEQFRNGQLHGTSKWYAADGKKIERVIDYHYGRLNACIDYNERGFQIARWKKIEELTANPKVEKSVPHRADCPGCPNCW